MNRTRKRLAPKGETHACFVMVDPRAERRSWVETLGQMPEEELMLEVDLIRTVDTFFRHSKLEHRYEIRVSSSELVDAIFDECNVDLADRLPLLQLLHEM
mmetsp:Transcript_10996/g.14870  ORF Transcript_10996/g.14870 Transcript_10996/m.14870 type:complete len:100 (-) Transcript_10996:1601-1900(-)